LAATVALSIWPEKIGARVGMPYMYKEMEFSYLTHTEILRSTIPKSCFAPTARTETPIQVTIFCLLFHDTREQLRVNKRLDFKTLLTAVGVK